VDIIRTGQFRPISDLSVHGMAEVIWRTRY